MYGFSALDTTKYIVPPLKGLSIRGPETFLFYERSEALIP